MQMHLQNAKLNAELVFSFTAGLSLRKRWEGWDLGDYLAS